MNIFNVPVPLGLLVWASPHQYGKTRVQCICVLVLKTYKRLNKSLTWLYASILFRSQAQPVFRLKLSKLHIILTRNTYQVTVKHTSVVRLTVVSITQDRVTCELYCIYIVLYIPLNCMNGSYFANFWSLVQCINHIMYNT